MIINNNVKYIIYSFLLSIICIIFIGFILTLTFNTNNYELTTLNLIIYLYVIFGILLVLILYIKLKQEFKTSSFIEIITNNLKFIMIDLSPVILIIISVLSLMIINYDNNNKINNGNLTKQFYLFNKIYLAILFFQFLNFFIYFKNKINNSNNTFIYKIVNYILSVINIIITIIIWSEVNLFTTDG
jgi:hypothetical protein